MRYRAPGLAGLFVAMVSTLSTVGMAQPDKPSPTRHISVNGIELSYVEQGTGTPVVFVHGAVSDLRFWEPQRKVFAKQYRFIAYSYRYHGTEP
jgi:hypothetical protein